MKPEELIQKYLRGDASKEEVTALDKVLAESEALRKEFRFQAEVETHLREVATESTQMGSMVDGEATPSKRFWLWILLGLMLVGLALFYVYRAPDKAGSQSPYGETEMIATLERSRGVLRWTGNQGQITQKLKEGQVLGGGTLETQSADAWAQLALTEGSNVTLSGSSALTMSQQQQFKLLLRKGRLLIEVPETGQKMNVQTPLAALEMLGSECELITTPSTTTLLVVKGDVVFRHLSSGTSVKVPAGHQVVATLGDGHALNVVGLSDSVGKWKSNLPEGIIQGRWLPEPGGTTMGLRASPQLQPEDENGHSGVLYQSAIAVDQKTPVVLERGAVLHLYGRADTATDLWLGVTLKSAEGGFAGNFIAYREAEKFSMSGGSFHLQIPVDELISQDPENIGDAIGLGVSSFWCYTKNKDIGLRIFSVSIEQP